VGLEACNFLRFARLAYRVYCLADAHLRVDRFQVLVYLQKISWW
jgi:hypothetical protein